MKKIDKNLIIGIIQSAMHKIAKLIEQGNMVTGDQFEELLHEKNKLDHLYFFVEEFKLISGRDKRGNPRVKIIINTTAGIRFKASFIVGNPPGTFTNQTPFAQEFNVEEKIEY